MFSVQNTGFIYLANYSLTTYYILVILLGAGDTKINRTHSISKRVCSIVDILFVYLFLAKKGGLRTQVQICLFFLIEIGITLIT